MQAAWMFRLARLCLALSAMFAVGSRAEAQQSIIGPADERLQIELLRALTNGETKTCGIGSFYSWFWNTLNRPGESRSQSTILEAVADSFQTEEVRSAFRSAIPAIAHIAKQNRGPTIYPAGAPKRSFCVNSDPRKQLYKVEFSQPFRSSKLIFIEQTQGGYSDGKQVDVLAFKRDVTVKWREIDMVVGSISD